MAVSENAKDNADAGVIFTISLLDREGANDQRPTKLFNYLENVLLPLLILIPR